MHQTKLVISAAVLLWITYSFLATAALGSYGDYDGDGDIDGADFFEFASCMTGPAGDPVGMGCEPFDYDVDMANGPDGTIDMVAFAAFQRAAPQPPESCTAKPGYVRLTKGGDATGVSGQIRTRITLVKLCDEPNVGPASGTAAWVGVSKFLKYVQMGYARVRFNNSDITYNAVYCELYLGDGPPDLPQEYQRQDFGVHPQVGFTLPQSGLHTYRCVDVAQGGGRWDYLYDDLENPMFFFLDNQFEWGPEAGNRYEWSGEVTHLQNDMPGRPPALKCDFSDLLHRPNWGGWEQTFVLADTPTLQGSVYSTDKAKWGYDIPDPDFSDTFRIWDKEWNP